MAHMECLGLVKSKESSLGPAFGRAHESKVD